MNVANYLIKQKNLLFTSIVIFSSSAIAFPVLAESSKLVESNSQHLSNKAADSLAQRVTQVTGVEIIQTENGLELVLETVAGSEQLVPLIIPEGNNLVIDILDATLALPVGDEFRESNPAPGINQISVVTTEDNSIRVTIEGESQTPSAEVIPSSQNLVLSVDSQGTTAQTEPDEEITITATRKEERTEDVPRSITVINQEQIEEQSRTSRDLADIISKTTPGVNPPTGSVRSLNVRGRPAQVLIDGIPVTSNISNDTLVRDLRAISPDAVERIEVIRGPSAVYGDGATGGVINIITKEAVEGETKLTTTLESNAALGDLQEDSIGTFFSQSVSTAEKGINFFGSFSTRNDGIYYDADGDRIPFQDSGTGEADVLQLAGTLGFELSENQDLQFSVTHNNEQYDYSIISDPSVDDLPLGATSARALDGGQDYIGTDSPQTITSTASLNYTHRKLLGNNQLDAQLFYRDFEADLAAFDGRVFDDPLEVNNINQLSDRWGGRLQLNTPIIEPLEVLWGVDYSKEGSEENTVLFDPEEFDNSNGRTLRAIEERTVYPRFDLENLGLFAQAEWDITPQWLLSGGLRYERIDVSAPDFIDELGGDITGGELDFDDVAFNAGLVFKATDNISLFTSFSQGFSIPAVSRIFRNAEDGFDLENDVDISQPQKVDNYELGIRGEWQKVQFSLAGFYNESELGTTLVTLDDARFATLVRAPQRNYGVEATLDYQIANTWQIGSSFTWQEGEDDQDEDGEFEALSSFDISPIKITAYVENETLPGWNNRLQLLYVSDRNRAVDDGTEFVETPIEGYTLVDLISSLELGAGTLSLGIDNLFDADYATIINQTESFANSFTFRGRGRSIRLGYQFDW
ncbi:TonB-dependent receptor [Pleurocapsales cyanobacterium LEGE 10410]|nr:TonB-dependent receptor [Pleurocapsales cyanobacterium LEGE 10410]